MTKLWLKIFLLPGKSYFPILLLPIVCKHLDNTFWSGNRSNGLSPLHFIENWSGCESLPGSTSTLQASAVAFHYPSPSLDHLRCCFSQSPPKPWSLPSKKPRFFRKTSNNTHLGGKGRRERAGKPLNLWMGRAEETGGVTANVPRSRLRSSASRLVLDHTPKASKSMQPPPRSLGPLNTFTRKTSKKPSNRSS